MQLPHSVNIMGITYQVSEVPVVSKTEDLLGEIDYTAQTIRIDAELSPEKKGQVFMHELLHGAMESVGLDDWNQNENAVQSLAAVLYHTLSAQTISFS